MKDEIGEKIKENDMGIPILDGNTKTGCLLWMDDVVLMSNDRNEIQEMLNITEEIANRYRIVFGKDKSNIITIGGKHKHELKLGNMTIEQTDTYKYLGITMNGRDSMEDHINNTERKMEGAYQMIQNIAKDENFRGITMETIWEMAEKCLIPIMTYGIERNEKRH